MVQPATFRGGPVVIVGGGVVGLSIAYHLAAAGHSDVTVLERGLLGEGATAKATGGIRQQFSSEANAAISRDAVHYFEHFADLVGEPFEFRQHGYLFVTTSDRVLEGAAAGVDLQRRLGIPAEVVDPGRIADLHPHVRTDDLVGGTWCATDGSGSPADLAQAFARRARRLGVTIRQHTGVVGVDRDEHGAVRQVHTAEGDHVPAEIAINAAGPWAAQVGEMVGIDLPVRPTPRQAFAIAPLDWVSADLPLTVDLDSGAYLHPERSGGVLGGTDRDRESSLVESVDESRLDRLIAAATHRIPALADARVLRGWAGLREMTPDDHAMVGPVDEVPGLWLAVGFSGHGFMQSPIIGRELARWLLDGRPGMDLSRLSPDRFAAGEVAAEGFVF